MLLIKEENDFISEVESFKDVIIEWLSDSESENPNKYVVIQAMIELSPEIEDLDRLDMLIVRLKNAIRIRREKSQADLSDGEAE
jgi:hypothetical protein